MKALLTATTVILGYFVARNWFRSGAEDAVVEKIKTIITEEPIDDSNLQDNNSNTVTTDTI